MARSKIFHSKNYGGSRPGAGRPSVGMRKVVSVSMPEEEWQKIDRLIESKNYTGYADYFRSIHLKKEE